MINSVTNAATFGRKMERKNEFLFIGNRKTILQWTARFVSPILFFFFLISKLEQLKNI